MQDISGCHYLCASVACYSQRPVSWFSCGRQQPVCVTYLIESARLLVCPCASVASVESPTSEESVMSNVSFTCELQYRVWRHDLCDVTTCVTSMTYLCASVTSVTILFTSVARVTSVTCVTSFTRVTKLSCVSHLCDVTHLWSPAAVSRCMTARSQACCPSCPRQRSAPASDQPMWRHRAAADHRSALIPSVCCCRRQKLAGSRSHMTPDPPGQRS